MTISSLLANRRAIHWTSFLHRRRPLTHWIRISSCYSSPPRRFVPRNQIRISSATNRLARPWTSASATFEFISLSLSLRISSLFRRFTIHCIDKNNKKNRIIVAYCDHRHGFVVAESFVPRLVVNAWSRRCFSIKTNQ